MEWYRAGKAEDQSVTEGLSPISSPFGNVADDAQKRSPKQRQEQKQQSREQSVRTTSGSASTMSPVYGKVPSQTVTSCSFAPLTPMPTICMPDRRIEEETPDRM